MIWVGGWDGVDHSPTFTMDLSRILGVFQRHFMVSSDAFEVDDVKGEMILDLKEVVCK